MVDRPGAVLAGPSHWRHIVVELSASSVPRAATSFPSRSAGKPDQMTLIRAAVPNLDS